MDTSETSSQQLYQGVMGSLLERRNLFLGLILLVALLGFESFNYSTTFYALKDLLGEMRFAGISWATILSLAFCGIDFAGIARLFSSDESESSSKEIWFLFIAWLLAATLNATLTWWGVSIAIVNHPLASTAIVDPKLLVKVVPIFVAVAVWVTRILVISAISSAGSRFFTAAQAQPGEVPYQRASSSYQRTPTTQPVYAYPKSSTVQAANHRPRTQNRPDPIEEYQPEPEFMQEPYYPSQPSFHSLSAKGSHNNSSPRK